ncbi:MAG: HipA domain-containing protein [Proteobacteria bacterium]|nr:HipA domain-containing protein [Pseudomonadota bacterium]MBU0966898.1 HipA domain-containing protein [Pseudomonadota bacterium]
MAEKKVVVFIYLPEETVAVPAGIFTHDSDAGIGSFAYGRKYLARKNALPVDPIALPLAETPREVTTNGGLYGAFRDASPDYWGRLVIAADAKLPPEALSEIDFLLAGNATRVGNLDFRSSPEAPEPELVPPHFNQLDRIIQVAGKIEAGEETEHHLVQLLRQGTSMGGARPKCTVEWEEALWIAKFPAKDDTLNIPRIEYANLKLAQQCGIQIPEVHLIQTGGKDVFLTRRFDREKSESGWKRKGFISAFSFMQWDERDQLKWEYSAIADNMRRHMAPIHIHELFRRMVFNILVRNTDDHPRNHGMLFNGDIMSLSPAYDIVPSFTRLGIGSSFRLAMSVGGQGREANLENALSHSSRFGLPTEAATEIVKHLITVTRNWREIYRRFGIDDRELDLLAPSFAFCNQSVHP